jgi:hypothetical protein
LKRIATFFLLALASITVLASEKTDSIPRISFQLLDASTQGPIGLAHIVNRRKGIGTISDLMGYFRIPFATGDTITISALGYYDMVIPSWGQFSADSMYYPVNLTSRIYQIKEVRITRFGSYQRFILEAAKMDMPKSEQEEVQERLEVYMRKAIKQMNLVELPSGTGGFSFGKDWFTKQREKIEAKSREEQKWSIILQKFSAGIVEQLTGLKGNETIKFMEYCDFTEAYILTSSEYEIRKRIVDLFEDYKKSKQSLHK